MLDFAENKLRVSSNHYFMAKYDLCFFTGIRFKTYFPLVSPHIVAMYININLICPSIWICYHRKYWCVVSKQLWIWNKIILWSKYRALRNSCLDIHVRSIVHLKLKIVSYHLGSLLWQVKNCQILHFAFNSNMRRLHQTSSNAFDMSIITPSYPSSNDAYIPLVNDKSWLTQKSPGLKLDWFVEIRWFVMKKKIKYLVI